MNNLSEELKRAYKKLKSSVYFDKTQLILRNRIVKYECDRSEPLDKIFLNIEQILYDTNSHNWNNYKANLLNSIQALTLPKSLNLREDNNLVINDSDDNVTIKDPQYFIDMEVEGHILGILWILIIGINIDKSVYEHSYGNRLKKTLLNEDGNTSFSPYLFKPYFEQYESWRDIGLEKAEACLNNNQDVLIITMDFKKYFHSLNFTKAIFDDFYQEYINDGINKNDIGIERVNDFVFEVLQKYSSFFSEYKQRVFLPIGFFPSNILSNWYLNSFDSEINNRWNPIYYGRYVDDIIIVDKIETNSILFDKISSLNSQNSPQIIAYFLYNCKDKLNIHCDEEISLFLKVSDEEKNKESNKENDIKYRVNPNILVDKDAEIVVQNSKVKLFYFKAKRSRALLTCFRNEISKNKSEFRYLPEDEAILQYDDYSEIYRLKTSDTIHKLSGVDEASVNKFNLSKFLGKFLRISTLINDKVESKFETDIEKIFNNLTVIENYRAWEKILLYFVVNERFEALINFIIKIYDAIINTEYSEKNDLNDKIISVNCSLRMFLYSSLCRALAHIWGPKVEYYINKLYEKNENNFTLAGDDANYKYSELLNIRQNYSRTRMCDKYIMPILLDTIINADIYNDKVHVNFSSFSDLLFCAISLDISKLARYQYYPYLVKPEDISCSLLINNIKDGKGLNDNDTVLKQIKQLFCFMNYPNLDVDCVLLDDLDSKLLDQKSPGGYNICAIKVDGGAKDFYKVALANTTLYETNFINVLTDKPDRSYKRYNRLSKIINIAIKNKADIIVLPESYVPFEWIPSLARISATTQTAIVAGIEHVKYRNSVYNITATMLPLRNEKYQLTYIGFHNKVYYAPNELETIEGYELQGIPGSSYDLFVWNDLWFSTYCCFELCSIKDRSIYFGYIDMLTAVEWNKDVNYYSNIIESLSRDLHCYCIQVNTSNYGDSRITYPARTEIKDIVRTKGGINDTVLIGKMNIKDLRMFQIKGYQLQIQDSSFKPTPPQFNKEIVRNKIAKTLWNKLKSRDRDEQQT